MRTILGCTLFAILAIASNGTADEKKIDAKLLIGKWEPKDSKEKFTIEFKKEGKLELNATGGKEFKADGTYKLEGNKLTLKLKLGDDEKSMVRTISKLSDTELTSKDVDKDKEDTLVRVKAK